MKAFSLPLRVVCYREDGDWVAHCLEFDLCGHGSSKKQAAEMLETAIQIQVEQSLAHDNPRNLFNPADGEFFQRFAAGTHVAEGEFAFNLKHFGLVIEAVEAREYSDEAADPELVHA